MTWAFLPIISARFNNIWTILRNSKDLSMMLKARTLSAKLSNMLRSSKHCRLLFINHQVINMKEVSFWNHLHKK
jgi:hypothetical protein